MAAEETVAVAIVGGGFSGMMLAAHLARRGIASVIIEATDRLAKGTAYSTTEPAHLLNVRAEGMSAWPDAPEDFARRFESEGGHRRGFAERRRFGAYLEDILNDAASGGLVTTRRASAVAARPAEGGGWAVTLDDGAIVSAGAVALAIGNQQPGTPSFARDAGRRFIANPWGPEARAAVAEVAGSGADVLLIGTGLTMVDLVLSLDSAGHQDRIVALSRRGLTPKAHADFDPAPVDSVPGGLRGLFRWLRGRASEVAWRAAVDSLRPHSQAIWQGLDLTEQRRFLRHARPWWDVHRHRIAPEVAEQLKRRIADGRLEVVAGKIVAMDERDGGLNVTYRRRGATRLSTESVAYAFNCTGPLHDMNQTRDPLLRSLLDAGLASADGLGIGLEVDGKSRVAGSDRLWALGPLTKGRYWEIIAVPDIRGQAAAVAEDIAMELGR